MAYDNILSAFEGSVWCIQEPKLREINRFMERVSAGDLSEMHARDYEQQASEREAAETSETPIYDRFGVSFSRGGKLATVPLHGTIFHRANMMSRFSGGSSTQMFTTVLRELDADTDVKGVLIDVDSPGGQALGLSEAADVVRSMSKPTYAVANGLMASAAYYIGSAADKVFAKRSAIVGSIGVYMSREDRSEQLSENGVKYHVFKSSDLKAKSDATQPLTEKQRADFEREIEENYDEFKYQLSLNLGYDMSKIEELANAQTHLGAKAEELGLVDATGTLEDAEAELAEASGADDAEDLEIAAQNDALAVALEEAQGVAQAAMEELQAAEMALQEERVTAAVETLVEKEQKVSPAKTDALRSRLMSDYEGTMSHFEEFVAAGSAAPSEIDAPVAPNGTEADDAEGALTDDELAEAIKASEDAGVPVARGEHDASVYEEMGVNYTTVDELRKGA